MFLFNSLYITEILFIHGNEIIVYYGFSSVLFEQRESIIAANKLSTMDVRWKSNKILQR